MGLISRVSSNLQRRLSSESNPAETCKMGIFMKALSFGVAGAGIAIFRQEMAEAGGDAIRPTTLNWPHTGVFDAYDASQLKRGFQVYRQVCSACHSINKLAFRQLVDVTHDEATMKELAKEYQVLDEEPDAEGNPVLRPGKLTDDVPGPYRNEMEARASNNGALPPDFRLIRNARTSGLDFKAGEDYIYHLLTGTVNHQPESPSPRDNIITLTFQEELSVWDHHFTTKSFSTKMVPQQL